MTRLTNTAESGLADGTTVTLANSDDGAAGDAFDFIVIGPTSSMQFKSAAAAHGSLGIRMQFANENTFARLGATGGPMAGATLACRFYFKFSAAPSAALHFGRILNSSSGVVMQYRLNTSRTFQILNAAGSGIGTSSALTAGTVYRVETWVTPATSTTGRVNVRLFAGEDTASPIISINNLTTNLGTAAPRILELGRSSGNMSIFIDYDSIVMDDGIGESFVGPVTPDPIVAVASGIGSGELFGSPSAALALTASPGGIASQEAFGTPAVDAALTASPTSIVGLEQFGAPTAALAVTASPSGISSAEGFGSPTALVESGDITAAPAGIPSGETFGTPSAALALDAVAAPIPSGEAFGDVTAGLALVAVPASIGSGEVFGVPTGVVDIIAVAEGIASGEAFGVPSAEHEKFDADLVLGDAYLNPFNATAGEPGFSLGAATLTDWSGE